jgi:hypothetical protein
MYLINTATGPLMDGTYNSFQLAMATNLSSDAQEYQTVKYIHFIFTKHLDLRFYNMIVYILQ